ncbi:MAG: glycoside hydrolase family 99-like domain-containing protein, partial [Prevotella sp.]|nr:glycoside hydrolase family 99-like domain-containing protein [Prevotella sp.]
GMSQSTLSFKIDADGKHHYATPNLESSADVFNHVLSMGFDAVNSFGKRRGEMLYEGKWKNIVKVIMRKIGLPVGSQHYDYARTVCNYFAPEDAWENVFPTILPQWDRSPRVASADGVYTNVTPQKFEQHIRQAIDIVKHKSPDHQVIFLKSWNEWGEGNYVEPDQKFGHGFLEAIRHTI